MDFKTSELLKSRTVPADAPCVSHTPTSEICILAVDDEPANLLALEAALRDCNYRLVTAQSGEDALAKVLKNEFAAILMDAQMPRLDGFETAKLIRRLEKSRHTPIIFLTSIFNDEHYVARGYEAGAVDYLYKPLNIPILIAKLDVFADLFRKNKELEYHSELLKQREREEKERQIAEIKRNTQKQYQDLVEGIRNGIVWSADAESMKFSFVSLYAESILGFPLNHWFDDSDFFFDRVHKDDRALLRFSLQDARHRGQDVELEHRMIRSDGTELWFHTNIRVAKTDKGEEFRGLCVDITRLKDTENSLRNMLQMRDEFLSIASHELKTPLTPLQLQVESFLRLFKEGRLLTVPEHKLKRLLEISGAQVEILTRLVDQLLDVSRITSGKLQLHYEETDLAECVRNILDLFQDQLASQMIELKTDLPKSLMGYWDRLRLEQVVVNLINNAIKYGEARPIEVALTTAGNVALLTVRDHGIGIAESDQERIFGRFERAVSHSNFSGLGLGLYITRQLVELHQGKIQVESEPGKGTVFTVRLPIHDVQ